MKSIVIWCLALSAGCTDGGVSGDPQAGWDDTVAAFADARCEWNWTCANRQDSQCVVSTTGLLASSRAELDASSQVLPRLHGGIAVDG